MKKIYTIAIVSFLVVASLGISIYQYIATTNADLANAASTKPANGHSWAEMEADSDSIQVTGQTITNLALPTNAADAASKEYVDAASGGGIYETCYILRSATSGVACATGFTTIAHHYGNNTCWIVDNVLGTTNSLMTMFTLGSTIASFEVGLTYISWSAADTNTNWGSQTYHPGDGLCLGNTGWADNTVVPIIRYTINGTSSYIGSGIVKSSPQTFSICCK